MMKQLRFSRSINLVFQRTVTDVMALFRVFDVMTLVTYAPGFIAGVRSADLRNRIPNETPTPFLCEALGTSGN